MAREFELSKEVALDATPEQVWEAIATGPGIGSWFMPHEVEPGEGGTMRLSFGDFTVESTVTAWDPPKRLAVVTGAGEERQAFEYLVEGRGHGSTVLRFVQSGFLGDDWDAEYDSLSKGWDMYFHTLAQYLAHFPGRTATFVYADGPPVSAGPDAWPVLLAGLGLTADASEGDTVRLTPAGLPPIDAVVDYLRPTFLGLRGTDALYRFHGRAALGMPIGMGNHLFTAEVDQAEECGRWQSWLNRLFGTPPTVQT